jgi:hypothetical protein
LIWDEYVTHIGKTRNTYQILVGNKGKKPFGQPRSIYKDNTEIRIWEIGCGTKAGFNWVKIRVQYFCVGRTLGSIIRGK